MLELVGEVIQHRIAEGISTGKMSDQAASVGRLYSGVSTTRLTSIAFELAGSSRDRVGRRPTAPPRRSATTYLLRQVSTLGGGTTEMARNVISERVLGMPRELSYDRNTPFRDVPKGPPAK